jgi:hypothetical protein
MLAALVVLGILFVALLVPPVALALLLRAMERPCPSTTPPRKIIATPGTRRLIAELPLRQA